jgi:uncharacterized membrane protein YoaT (DUF817 family)
MVQRDALPLFQVLQEKYGVPLSRDAAFKNVGFFVYMLENLGCF